jgi:hypothetical protein
MDWAASCVADQSCRWSGDCALLAVAFVNHDV